MAQWLRTIVAAPVKRIFPAGRTSPRSSHITFLSRLGKRHVVGGNAVRGEMRVNVSVGLGMVGLVRKADRNEGEKQGCCRDRSEKPEGGIHKTGGFRLVHIDLYNP
jgi:hypothetical protein